VHTSLHFEIGASVSRTSQMRTVIFRFTFSSFPCDVSHDVAFFYALLAACMCQNVMIVCDRDTQITKAFPVTQEQMTNNPRRLRLRENRMRNVHLPAVKN